MHVLIKRILVNASVILARLYVALYSVYFRNSFIVMTANCLTSLFGGLVVFAVLGFMAHETHQPIDKVVSSGKVKVGYRQGRVVW